MNLEQIKELMAELEGSKLKKLVVKSKDFELQLEKEGEQVSIAHLPPPYQPARTAAFVEQLAQAAEPMKASSAKAAAVEVKGKYVSSPMVGTYYSSPSPEQPAFVKVGDRVEEHTVVCIIEAMKVMNEVKAGVSGTVAEILIENAQPLEFGAKILRIE